MSVERTDLPARPAGWALAGVLATLALAGAIVALFLACCGSLREPTPRPPALRAAPMLQVSERGDRAVLDARTRNRAPTDDDMQRTAAAGWDAKP